MPTIIRGKRTGRRLGVKGGYKRKKAKAHRYANSKQIVRNMKQIKRLNETQFRSCSYITTYQHGPAVHNQPATSVPPILVKPLIVPNQWLPIFGSQPLLDPNRVVQKVVHPDNFLITGCNIKVNLRLAGFHIGNSQMPIHYHYMVFSIKREFREQVKYRTSGTPGIISPLLDHMVEGVDYKDFDMGLTIPGVNAQWRLNRDIYTVHASRKGRIGVWPAPLPLATSGSQAYNYRFTTSTNLNDCNRDLNLNVKWKRNLKHTGYSEAIDPLTQSPTRNSWKTLNVEQVADSDQLYRVLFHNAQHPEQSPIVMSESVEFFGSEPQ
ncbi:MAG: hypothetical protein [Circular genetic element sp.]|nr:MAG: hypothetical protein [Circular genetic element sp.]